MENLKNDIEKIKDAIGIIPNFPKQGIIFRDIFPLFLEPILLKQCIKVMIDCLKTAKSEIDCIVGLDARGFLFGPVIAMQLNIPFLAVRKVGKLPGKVLQESYSLEYGNSILEMQEYSFMKGKNVVIVDDLLATGGTLEAAINLVKTQGANVSECLVLIELVSLNGSNKLNCIVTSIVKYE